MTRKLLLPLVLMAAALALPVQAQVNTTRSARPAAIRAEPASPRVDEIFAQWDANHNGTLSRLEFESGWRELRQGLAARQRLRGQFGSVDANDNHAIDAGEYHDLLLVKQAGTKAPPLSTFDKDGNGKLEFGEYLGLVRGMSGSRDTRATRAGKAP